MPIDFNAQVLKLSKEKKDVVNMVYRAVLRAVQYDAMQYDGNAFHLLEGTVRKTKNGHYIFTPNKHLEEMLNTTTYPALLKIEESRFLDLLTLAMQE